MDLTKEDLDILGISPGPTRHPIRPEPMYEALVLFVSYQTCSCGARTIGHQEFLLQHIPKTDKSHSTITEAFVSINNNILRRNLATHPNIKYRIRQGEYKVDRCVECFTPHHDEECPGRDGDICYCGAVAKVTK